MARTIALINYPGCYFKGFADALKEQGFNLVWVCINHSDAVYMTHEMSIPESQVLDVNLGFSPLSDDFDLEECRKNLSSLETEDGPRIFDIIQMDRMLRTKSTPFSLQYINHCAQAMRSFFCKHQVSLISSGRDSALQLTSMLVGRQLNIAWVVPTRLRIPRDTYGFCTNHETNTFIQLKDANPGKDREWAIEVLAKFDDPSQKPALKIAAQSFKDVLKLRNSHFMAFKKLYKRSLLDKGNDFSRYTIPKIIKMYVDRRINMLMFNIYKPWKKTGSGPFCIYALHTQPESSIDVAGSYFSDQLGLIQFIARSLPITHELYVKIHPTDIDGKNLKFYRAIQSIPGVRLIHNDLDSGTLINRCDIIFALTGTIGFEGGLMGKRVITFANNYYNELPTVHYCEAPPKLPMLINSILNKPAPNHEAIRENILRFLSIYRSRVFDGEVNRMFGANPSALLDTDNQTLKIAYEILFKKLVGQQSET